MRFTCRLSRCTGLLIASFIVFFSTQSVHATGNAGDDLAAEKAVLDDLGLERMSSALFNESLNLFETLSVMLNETREMLEICEILKQKHLFGEIDHLSVEELNEIESTLRTILKRLCSMDEELLNVLHDEILENERLILHDHRKKLEKMDRMIDGLVKESIEYEMSEERKQKIRMIKEEVCTNRNKLANSCFLVEKQLNGMKKSFQELEQQMNSVKKMRVVGLEGGEAQTFLRYAVSGKKSTEGTTGKRLDYLFWRMMQKMRFNRKAKAATIACGFLGLTYYGRCKPKSVWLS